MPFWEVSEALAEDAVFIATILLLSTAPQVSFRNKNKTKGKIVSPASFLLAPFSSRLSSDVSGRTLILEGVGNQSGELIFFGLSVPQQNPLRS